MKLNSFYVRLLLPILLALMSLNFLFEMDKRSLMFNYVLIGFYGSFCILFYYLSLRALNSKDPYLFTRIFLISVFVKIGFTLFFIVFAIRKLEINKEEIILPCLSFYLLFTIFETYELMKLSRHKGIKTNQ